MWLQASRRLEMHSHPGSTPTRHPRMPPPAAAPGNDRRALGTSTLQQLLVDPAPSLDTRPEPDIHSLAVRALGCSALRAQMDTRTPPRGAELWIEPRNTAQLSAFEPRRGQAPGYVRVWTRDATRAARPPRFDGYDRSAHSWHSSTHWQSQTAWAKKVAGRWAKPAVLALRCRLEAHGPAR